MLLGFPMIFSVYPLKNDVSKLNWSGLCFEYDLGLEVIENI